MAAYHWLSENYRKGDLIFLFGTVDPFLFMGPTLNLLLLRILSQRISGPCAGSDDQQGTTLIVTQYIKCLALIFN